MSWLAPLRSKIEPWETWARSEPMCHKIKQALETLAHHHEKHAHCVWLSDLEKHRVGKRKGTEAHQNVRALFDAIKQPAKTPEAKAGRSEHIKHILIAMSPQQLADAIASLPDFMQHQPKPTLLRFSAVEEHTSTAITAALNGFLSSIHAPTVSIEVVQGLLEVMGTEVAGRKR